MTKRMTVAIIGLALSASAAVVDWKALETTLVGHAVEAAGHVVAVGPWLDGSG